MKRTVILGFLLALSLILSYVELLVPIPIPIPGIKLGLANLAVIFVLYIFGVKEAFLVNILRIFMTGFLFTNFYMILYSLAGGILSLAFMAVCKKRRLFTIKGISIIGGVTHNIGQLMVAYCVVRTYGIFYYVPFLLISGAVTGFLIGVIEEQTEPGIRRLYITSE